MKKRVMRLVSTCLAGCVVLGCLAGCGSSNNNAGNTGSIADGSAGARAEGGQDKAEAVTSIKIGTTESWDTLTPFRTTQSQYSSMVRLIYDRLAYQTADNRYIPQAAKSWEVEADNLTWNVELYDYIEDSKGNHITASDLVWMLEESMKQGLKPCFNKIDSVEKTGDYTFKVKMKQDIVNSFELILVSTYVVSQKAFEGNNAYSIEQRPSSNGMQAFFSGDAGRAVATDENLCRAICHAIDADGIVVGVYNGYAKPMHDAAVESVVGYLPKWNEEEYFFYDVEKAKEYLGQSDYNGQELELFCMSDSTTQRVAQMIQNYLLAVGIKLKLNIVDSALFSASRFDGSQYDIILVQAGAGSLPAFWSNRFDCSAYEKGDGTARNDEVLREMLYETWSEDGFTEANIDAVHQYLIDHVYAYGICLPTSSTVYSNKLAVVDFVSIPSGNLDFAACVYQK